MAGCTVERKGKSPLGISSNGVSGCTPGYVDDFMGGYLPSGGMAGEVGMDDWVREGGIATWVVTWMPGYMGATYELASLPDRKVYVMSWHPSQTGAACT